MIRFATPAEAAPAEPQTPTLASPPRRAFHMGIAILGWVVFTWWWIVVLGRVRWAEVLFTGCFILVTLAVVVGLTAAWAAHNRLLFKRKGPRTRVREVTESYARDRLGRALHFTSSLASLRSEPVVVIRLEHLGKTYRPGAPSKPRDGHPTRLPNTVAATHESR